MKWFKILLILTVLGIAMAGLRPEREVENSLMVENGSEEAGFGDFFKKAFKKVTGVAKKAVNKVKSVGKKAVGGVKNIGKKAIGGIKKVGKKAVGGVKNIGKKAVGGLKHGIVDVVGKKGIVETIGKKGIVETIGKKGIVETIGKNGILRGIEETKKGFMKIGKFTEEQSKKYINEVKKIGLKVGKTLDPRQIMKVLTPDNLKKVLEGIRLVTGPMQGVLEMPMLQQMMGSNPLLKQAYMFLTTGVKLINDPEDYQNILMDSNIVSDLIGHFVVDTVNNPDSWMENLVTAAPKAMELMETAVQVAAMAA